MSVIKQVVTRSVAILLALLPLMTASVAAAGQWSNPVYTKPWSEPVTTEQWSQPATTEQWSEPITTEQWSEPIYTEPWSEPPVVQTPPTTGTPPVTPLPPAKPDVPQVSRITFDVAPRVENGRTLVPLRKIFELLGANVAWDDAAQQITAVKGQLTIKLWVNSKTAYVNSKVITLDVPPMVWLDRTLVPMRFVSEALGSNVDYDPATTRVTIDNRYFFHIDADKQNAVQINDPGGATEPTSSDDYFGAHKAYFGKWYVWVSGGWTAPDPVTGISTYTKGAGGGTLTIEPYGTFVWDMQTAVYKGIWAAHPTSPGNLLLRSTDGWDYTLTMADAKTIKWYSYGIEYYGTRD